MILKDLFKKITSHDISEYDFSDLDCILNPEMSSIIFDKNKISSALLDNKDIKNFIDIISNKKNLIYALIAPAFWGQFKNSSQGKLRSALKSIGFDGMIEVALFADILTLKEAFEFDKNINKESDFQLTSCCCPMWIAMIRKIYSKLLSHVPGSVSPMIASGRAIKNLYPNAITVFIGPCLAKKSEAKEKDLLGAIDYVLTFKEMELIFNSLELNFENMPENNKEHSSKSGRIYAYAGGVGEAVAATLKKINPDRNINIKIKRADGIPSCKAMINELLENKLDANFFEGMGCIGGCVGGPKAIINSKEAKENINSYGASAKFQTPIDNPYVIELLSRLGFETVESLIEDNKFFTRKF